MATTDGIAAFWAWWPAARERICAALENHRFGEELIEEIGERVQAVQGGLDWEVGPGDRAPYFFCLSAAGDPVSRRITERWLKAAPAPDQTWEYLAARPPKKLLPKAIMKVGEVPVGLDDFVASFEVDENREFVNVRCFNPVFPRMDEEQRGRATFLMLDGMLGEDGVERWIGGIKAAAAVPAGARPIAELRAAIDALAKTATGERGVILKGQNAEGQLLFASLNSALKRIDHLDCDIHAAIDLALLTPSEQGLTTNEEAQQLNAIEDELTPLLPGAVYFGRETCAGRRVIHYFAPGDSLSRARLDKWASGSSLPRSAGDLDRGPGLGRARSLPVDAAARSPRAAPGDPASASFSARGNRFTACSIDSATPISRQRRVATTVSGPRPRV